MNNQPKDSPTLNWLIVIGTVAMVLVPVVVGHLPTEIARWHLAAAANSLAKGDGRYEEHIAAANRWIPIEQERDFWLPQIQWDLKTAPERLPETLRKAIEADPRYRRLAVPVALQVWDHPNFAEDAGDHNAEISSDSEFAEDLDSPVAGRTRMLEIELAILETAYEPDAEKPLPYLNQIAYTRALLIRDLDQALADINLAIQEMPDEGSFRDTRAWVLYQMGRPQDAIADADFAVEQYSSSFEMQWYDNAMDWLEQRLIPSGEAEESEVRTRRTTESNFWNLAVLHYHRAKILDALGRTEDAEVEWQWLRSRNFPLDDRLY